MTTDGIDQYDTVLREMEPGLLVTVNESTPGGSRFPEMEVVYSEDDRTLVDLAAAVNREKAYQIKRRSDGLVIGRARESGLYETCSIETIEIVGIGGETPAKQPTDIDQIEESND